MNKQKKKQTKGRSLTSTPDLSFLHIVQEEVDGGGVLLPVRAGHLGKHYVRPERPAEEPRQGPRREKLSDPSPALAHRQPGHPHFRPRCIL